MSAGTTVSACVSKTRYLPCPEELPEELPVEVEPFRRTLLMIVWSPAARTAYAEPETRKYREISYDPPPSKWPTRPREVKGRTKNAVSEMVFAIPKLPNGVNESNLWLNRLVQSAVARPVLKPRLLSPVGAVTSTVEL